MKHRGKIIGFTVIVIVIAAAAVAGRMFISGSSTGTVSVKTPQATKPVVAPTLIAEQGEYADFTYPNYFVSVTPSPAVSPVLKNYDYLRQKLGSWQLNIQISSLPTGNLRDNGSYNYRSRTSQQYSFTTQQINGRAVPIASDKTNASFNKVAYLAGPSKVATISLMGGDGQEDDQMQSALTAILASWQWH